MPPYVFTNAFVPQIITGGLSLRINDGKFFLPGTGVVRQGVTTLVLPASATNYVYYDYSLAAVVSNTTGYPAECYPIATAVTGSTTILTLTDDRVDIAI